MSQQPPGLHIHQASLRFAGQTVFENLSCEMPAGEWTCILGASGVGKSSLLRLLAGLVWPDDKTQLSGKVFASDGLPLQHRVAYMAQQDLLLPWLSVLDNVMIGYKLRGAGNIKKPQAIALLNEVGLGNVVQQRPASLSGGMRQRVALARTLLEDRPVVLMDEPFSALDVITRLRLQELAARLLIGRTVILVTHDPLEAIRLGHHIHVLAGAPAQMSDSLHVPGSPPRQIQQTDLLTLQATLLEKLAQAQEGCL